MFFYLEGISLETCLPIYNGIKPIWPPRTWEHVKILFVTLQAAHMWIALLSMAARIQEVLNLARNCNEEYVDGEFYIEGKTYKLSECIAGEDRTWPVPKVLIKVLAQQVELVSVCETIGHVRDGGSAPSLNGPLWTSLVSRGRARPHRPLADPGQALRRLAVRLGLSEKAGGDKLHPHRFRKTVARLVALAIVESPRVLMRLLGHGDINMTLSYILADKGLQVEIDKVARELRVMRCKEIVDSLHDSLQITDGLVFGGFGGGAMPRILEAVKDQDEKIRRSNKKWNFESAYELAVALTLNGEYYRLVRPGVVCTKSARDFAPCICSSDCVNRIEEKTFLRDVLELVPLLVAQGEKALAENNLLVVANVVAQLDEELGRFLDLGQSWNDSSAIVKLRDALKE